MGQGCLNAPAMGKSMYDVEVNGGQNAILAGRLFNASAKPAQLMHWRQHDKVCR